jgi:hypothetical protein
MGHLERRALLTPVVGRGEGALGTRHRDGRIVEAIGAEVTEIVDGKIKEIRGYHKRLSGAIADSVQAKEGLR